MYGFDLLQKPLLRRDLRIGRQVSDQHGRMGTAIQDGVLKGLQHPGYRIGSRMLALLPFLDGTTSLRDLPARLHSQSGLQMELSDIQKILAGLVQYDLLDTPESSRKRQELAETFRSTTVRRSFDPSDRFYSKEPVVLEQMIQDCFFGGEDFQESRQDMPGESSPNVLILPHAAIQASGRTAASGLSPLLRTQLPELYLIIGPNHVYPGSPSATSITKPFQTPLGQVEVDIEAANYLIDLAGGTIVTDYLSHYRDHSIEMQLPFLQWLHRHHPQSKQVPVRILPLLITGERHRPGMREPEDHREVWHRLAQALSDFLSLYQKRTMILVSGDFTHWGTLFNFTPFDGTSKEDFYAWDLPLLESIAANDAKRFLEAWQATNCCAGRPVYIMLKTFVAQSWSMKNYHVNWSNNTAISFAAYAGYSKK